MKHPAMESLDTVQEQESYLMGKRIAARRKERSAFGAPRLMGVTSWLAFAVFLTLVKFSSALEPMNECFHHLEIADLDKNKRLTRSEFVGAINGMAAHAYDDYELLPLDIQEVFMKLSCRCLSHGGLDTDLSCCGGSNAAVDISGIHVALAASREEQGVLLESCEAIGQVLSRTRITSTADITPRQATPAPTPSTTQCYIGIIRTDTNPADSMLSSSEYTDFVNTLSNDAFLGSFNQLPVVLQDNFLNLATVGGQIDVFGVRPSEIASDQQEEFLDQLCIDTGIAINDALGVGVPTPPAPTPPAPTPTGPPAVIGPSTPRPTQPLNVCYVGMIRSDNAPKDSMLSQAEYTSFVDFLEPGPFTGLTFDQLPVALQLNFQDLSEGSVINISGLPSPSPEEQLFLELVCDQTNGAISLALNPNITPLPSQRPTPAPNVAPVATPAPTLPPTPSPTAPPSPQPTPSPTFPPTPSPTTSSPSVTGTPTFLSNEAVIVNVFVISNRNGITARQLNQEGNANRLGLDAAYSSLAEDTVEEQIVRRTRHLRAARRLAVDYGTGGTESYEDRPCPSGAVIGTLCQDVVASFTIQVSDDEDFDQVVIDAQREVDERIAAGNLDSILIAGGSPLRVEEGVPVVNPPSVVPTPSPTPLPTQPPVSGSYSGRIPIPSSFVISNTQGLTASDFGVGTENRNDLTSAYSITAQEYVGTQEDGATFVLGSAEITDISGVVCPGNTPNGSQCQAVFAEYLIEVQNDDFDLRQQTYIEGTQTSIAVGILQTNLNEINPTTPISIEEGTVPTQIPTAAPVADTSDDGPFTIAVISGIAVGGTVLLFCIALFIFNRQSSKNREAATKFDDGLQDDGEESSVGYNEHVVAGAYAEKDESEQSESEIEYSEGNGNARNVAAAQTDSSSDSSESSDSEDETSAIDSESPSEASSSPESAAMGTTVTSEGAYDYDDPSEVQGKTTARAVASDSEEESEEESEESEEASEESEGTSSEESSNGWDDEEDNSVSQESEPLHESQASGLESHASGIASFSDLAATRGAPEAQASGGISKGGAAGIGVAAGALAAGGIAAATRRKEESSESESSGQSSEESKDESDSEESASEESDSDSDSSGSLSSGTEYTSGADSGINTADLDDNTAISSLVGRPAAKHRGQSTSMSIEEVDSEASTSEDDTSESDESDYTSGSRSGSESGSGSRSGSESRSESESGSGSGSESRSDSESGSESRSDSESDETSDDDVDMADADDGKQPFSTFGGPGPVSVSGTEASEDVFNVARAAPAPSGSDDTHNRSALDVDESESEYTDSDNNTYEEATLDDGNDTLDGTIGTHDDSIDPDDAIALAEATTKRMEEADKQDDLAGRRMPRSGAKRDSDSDSDSRSSGSYSGSGSDGSYSRSGSDRSSSYSGSDRSDRSSSYSGDSRSRSDSGSESGSGSGSESGSDTDTFDYTTEGASTAVDTSVTETPAEIQRKQEVRAEVEALVRLVVPEEVDNIDAMMEQFNGREEELLTTLRTMQERSVTARARAAVHKSKARPASRGARGGDVGYRRDGQYSVDSRQTGESETSRGSAAASASIAAASVPRPATGRVPLNAPPVPAYERSNDDDDSSYTSDSEEEETDSEEDDESSPSRIRTTSVGSHGDLRGRRSGDSSGSDSESGSSRSESDSASGSESDYTSDSYTTSSSHSGNSSEDSESFDSKSLDDLPSRWKSDKPRPGVKKPWDKKSDAFSQSTDGAYSNDRNQALSVGDSYK